MAIKTFSVGEVLTSSDTNTYLNNGGLVYITQATVGSGVSNVDITNCFSATYDNYLISISGVAVPLAGLVGGFQVLSNGSLPGVNSWFGNTFYVVTGAGGGLTNAAIANGSYAEAGSMTNATGGNSFTFQVFAPFRSECTRTTYTNCDVTYWRTSACAHNAATSYNGFRLTAVGSTMTGGTITVYGYRKA
jgi:hypothetical protein